MNKTVLNHKLLPNFIKTHPVFSTMGKIEKIFPDIGLKNSEMLAGDLDTRKIAPYIKDHLKKIYGERARLVNLKRSKILKIINNSTPSDYVKNNKIIFPAVLAKLGININSEYYCDASDRHGFYYRPRKKILSYIIDPKYKIVFSSYGEKGVWDIATMSMRGISSCQSWRGGYKRNLVGSIVDPYCGIIYLTNEVQLSKGSKMLRRALVRYVVNRVSQQPCLFIERIYPTHIEQEPYVLGAFAAFLVAKTKNKFPIITRNDGKFYIPNSKVVANLTERFDDAKDGCRSYRDSHLFYGP